MTKLRWLILAGVLVTILEVLSLSGIRLPQMIAIPSFTLLILFVGSETLKKGIDALLRLKFKNINLLMIIAVIAAYYLGDYEEAAVLIVLFTLAGKLEQVGLAKSKSSLDSLMEKMPTQVFRKGNDIPVPVVEIAIGEIIIVKPHGIIPLDGEVVVGNSLVDEATITGEPLPMDKQQGDQVFAGTQNKQGVLEIQVKQTVGETTLDKIRDITFNATKTKAKTQKFIEKFSAVYTPIVLFLAFMLFFIPVLLGRPFEATLLQAMSLLVISCPCAVVISTPVSIYSAIGNASASGVLVKGGRYLEAIGQVKAIAFDKTRTLTFGEPIVTDVIPFGDSTREKLLACTAGIELFSEHPLAQSIVEAARQEGLDPHAVNDFESVVGKGAKGNCTVCYDSHHCIGKLEFILEEHSVPDEVIEKVNALQQEGKTVIVISSHKEVEGVIAIVDEVRPEAKELIETLDQMKIESTMLTGDHSVTAHAVAEQLGIKNVRSELLPEQKALEIKMLLNKYQNVAMVGDGVNDAPALATSSVGISMSGLSHDIALEAASIVILNNHLKVIPKMIRLGKRAIRMIRFNTTFAITIKFAVIALSLIGQANLALAIFADVGITLIVILNSLRLLR